MNADQILMEIRETNLSYLMLAQSLIRTDREQAVVRLGVSQDTATMIASLSPAQIMRIASSNTLLCRMQVDDELVWSLVTHHGKTGGDAAARQTAANLLLAARHQEAA
ncbi:MAG: flagellar transcriptional regulator FlhD [Rubrivivax sp.]|nr:MAG: flagellar transcriptional regulator FlhD [Rubrivivax sp.]